MEILEKYRNQIDKIDKKIIEYLGKRYQVVKKVGVLKKKLGLKPLDKKRWQKVLETRITWGKENRLPKKLIQSIYESIHDYSLEIEKKPKIIGIQGGRGSFNEKAILTYFKKNHWDDYQIKYLYRAENVFNALFKDEIDYGFFAIFNTLGGPVIQSVKAMINFRFKVVDKITILIRHFLMKRKDVDLKDISQIIAHPQVFAQCQNNLKKKYPHLKLISGKKEMIDTAKAAKALAEGRMDKRTAVLGPKILSQIYNFDIVDEDLQDDKNNRTTFFLVKR